MIASIRAALLAGVGAGAWPDVPAACAATIQITGRTAPDATAAAYQQLYPSYQALYPALKATFERQTAFSG